MMTETESQHETSQDIYGRHVFCRTPEGYRTKTQWAKQGRVPCCESTAIVIKETTVFNGLSFPVARLKESYTPVVADLGNNRWLVAKPNKGSEINWWLVYREDQTSSKSKASAGVKESSVAIADQPPPIAQMPVAIEDFSSVLDYFDSPISSLNLLPSSPSPSPIRCSDHRKANPDQGLMPLLTDSANRAVNRGNRAYFPEGVDRSAWPEQFRDAMTWIIHLIYLRRILDRCGKDEYVPLKTIYLREILGWREAEAAKTLLLRQGVIECDNHYVKGEKSKGYRLRHRDVTHRLVDIDNPTIRANVIKRHLDVTGKAVHKWLYDNLSRVTVDETAFEEVERLADTEGKREAYIGSIQAIIDGYLDFTVDDFAGRVHTNFSRLKRELKQYLRIDGQRPVEIDIKNSQPTFLAIVAWQRAVDEPAYRALCEAGRLYDWLAEKGGWTRAYVKEELMAKAFFSKNRYTNEVKRLFNAEFPGIATLIEKIKAKDHTKLAQVLQRAEAQYIIHGVCETIRKERPEIPVVTIHDSILTTPGHAEYVLQIMRDEFAVYRINPRLEAVNL